MKGTIFSSVIKIGAPEMITPANRSRVEEVTVKNGRVSYAQYSSTIDSMAVVLELPQSTIKITLDIIQK
jgi:hypothetical protein